MLRRDLLLLVLAALLSGCSTKDARPAGGTWLPLSAAGVTYVAPAGFDVTDPPLNDGELSAHGRWGFNLPGVQKNLAVASFHPGPRISLVVAVQGPEAPAGAPLSTLRERTEDGWTAAYWDHVLARDQKTEVVSLSDGTKLELRQARMVPGAMAGKETMTAIATGEVGGRWIAIGAGADRADLTAPESELQDAIRTVAASLTVAGDTPPATIADPG